MNTAEALAACEETVRRSDPDRYFAGLFAPPHVRPLLFALYAFNHEVARVGELNREPLLGAIRLQWWREAVVEAREGQPRAHPAAIGLVEIFSRGALQTEPFEALIDAREFDLSAEAFPDPGALESYCEATSSGLMRIAARILGDASGASQFLRHAGIVFALTGLLRAVPHHASRRKLYLPADLLENAKVAAEDVFAGKSSSGLSRTLLDVSARARAHFVEARKERPQMRELLAALPAAVSPLYLRRIGTAGFNPFRDTTDIALFRRQLALLGARLRGRL